MNNLNTASILDARQHEWTEDGAMFVVIANSHTPHLVGERFKGATVTSNEAVLAREILHLSQDNSELAADNLRLTDRVNALTARIEEALDLMLEKTEESGKVAEAYRKLERVLLAGAKETPE